MEKLIPLSEQGRKLHICEYRWPDACGGPVAYMLTNTKTGKQRPVCYACAGEFREKQGYIHPYAR